jgi:metal-sulfur cluster biosynthetic enzyme
MLQEKNMPDLTREDIIATLKKCYDPEIPIDLWNLGLIYNIEILESPNNRKANVAITMSLTTPGCGLANHIAQDVKSNLEGMQDVNEATVRITFEPRWNPSMMTEFAQNELGLELKPATEATVNTGISEWE